MAQERRVLLANGQYITIVQTTGTSSGDVMSQSAVTAALNAKANVSHTHNASAITGGTFGTNMIADGAITKAKLGSDVPIPTTLYEIVKVSGLTSDGSAAVGADVTIGGDFYKFDSTGVVSAQIPYGQVYKVQAYENTTWAGSYGATFTANTQSRSITITYGMPSGVYIEATDGILYASSNWTSGKTANSIVVVGNGVSFRIALTQLSSAIKMSNTSTTPLNDYMTAISSSTEAMADYDGAGNTAKILKVQPNTGYAAGYCNAFTFPDGKTKGCLPSFGQLYLAYQNKSAVNAALRACGGTAMNTSTGFTDYYSTSTLRMVTSEKNCNCWTLRWVDGNIYHRFLADACSVRPFAAY